MNRHFLIPWLVGLALLRATTAQAYCRTTACNPAEEVCETDQNGCPVTGKPLQWPVACVGVALNEKASVQVNYAEFERVVTASFNAWNEVRCDGQAPSIAATVVGPVACDRVKINKEKGNANLVVFRDDDWPHTGQSSVLALTTVQYGTETGTIYGADMEIRARPGDVRLTTGDEDVDTDLQSIITHEAGHFLGLAHTSVAEATMLPYYPPKSTKFRSLEADDRAGLCAAYPPARGGLPACDPGGPSPLSLGLSSDCEGERLVLPPVEVGGGCRAVAVGEGMGRGAGVGVVMAVALVARKRRRSACAGATRRAGTDRRGGAAVLPSAG